MGRLDLSYLKETGNNNKDFILEMISIFENQVKEFINSMDMYLYEKDYENLSKLIHKAKSSVTIIGLKNLIGELKKAEDFPKNDNSFDNFAKLVETFKTETLEALTELNEIKLNIDKYLKN